VLSSRFDVVIPLLYVGSSLALILAAGGSSTGVGLVVLLPILWSALNLELWKSLVVVVAVGAVEFVNTYLPLDVSDAVRLRRVVSWLAIGALFAYTIHEIRSRIERIGAQREQINAEMALTINQLNEQNRSTSVLSKLVEQLGSCDVIEEAYNVFEQSADEMFETGGSISILNEASNQIEVKSTWRGFDKSGHRFPSSECRALEQSSAYESNADGPACEHLHDCPFPFVRCQPLLIKKEVIGVLTVSLSRGNELAPEANQLRHYARLVSDQISIWMANFTLRESLKNSSIRDPLTNLFNRRFMVETLNREVSVTVRDHAQISIIQADIDYFKQFNDSFGHEVGDSVLRAVADVMFTIFRDSDVPCRSGGEEFTLILPRCSWNVANARAIELQARVNEIVIPMPDGLAAPLPPTLSIGIATSPEHGLTSAELLRGADKALYAAKAAGRNCIVKASVVAAASAFNQTTAINTYVI
jgi:diguanylate cyclase (GGDEF)-like protein